MGVTLTTKALTKENAKMISAGRMEKFDLKKLRMNVYEYVEPVKKRFTLALVLLTAMTLLMGATTAINLGNSGELDFVTLLFIFVPMILFLAIAFGFIGWLSFGRITGRFNRALKKGYPELYEELRI